MRALIAEDDAVLANTWFATLRGMGIHSDVARTPTDAVELSHATTYDFFIVDLNLLGGDALAFCTQVRERQPRTPIVLLTGSDAFADGTYKQKTDVDYFFRKPVPIREFREIVGHIQQFIAVEPSP